jgi:hypothetical protein
MDISELEDFKLSDAVKFHNELNPNLWENNKLKPEVKKQLLKIANDFILELGVAIPKIQDITISGSNAAYSYTPYSDLDLHILVDFNKLPDDEIYQELFTAKKNLYNDEHDISVHGVPVELYVQDSNQPHVSLGEYSIVNDDWIRIPKKKKANFDQNETRAKYEKLGTMIELALKSNSLEKVEKVLDVLKRYRKAGLQSTGEFGPENLSYKALRKLGYIQKLYDYKNKLHSKELSLEDYDPTYNVKESVKFIEGTNCKNCVWWKKDSEKPVGKDELNKYGGLKPPNKEYIAMSKRVDLVTLPGKDTVKVKGFCYHKDINDWVTERMCCAKWDGKGVLRDYKGESPLMESKEDAVRKIQKFLNKKYDANLDVDGVLGPLTLKSINKFMPQAKKASAPEPEKTTSVQGKKVKEASGYIPSEKEKNDPRFKTALTVDVKPDSILSNAKAFKFKTSRAGIPPTAKTNGKL